MSLLKMTDTLEVKLGTLKRSVRNKARVLGRSAVATAFSLTSLLAGAVGSAKAAAPDPATECIKANVTCVDPTGDWVTNAQNALDSGDNVYLTDGDLGTSEVYQFASPLTPRIYLNADNRQVYGEGPNNTTLRRDGFGAIFEVRNQGNKISDLALDDAREMIRMVGDNYDNVTIDNISGTNNGGQFIYFQRSDNPGNSAPNIWITNSVFDGGKRVIHFDDTGFPELVNAETKHVGIKFSEFKNIRDNGNGLVIDAPFYFDESGIRIYLGMEAITNSTMTDSDNNWNEDFIFPNSVATGDYTNGQRLNNPYQLTTTSQGIAGPMNIVEWNIIGDTLADRGIGVNNIEEDPRYNRKLWMVTG